MRKSDQAETSRRSTGDKEAQRQRQSSSGKSTRSSGLSQSQRVSSGANKSLQHSHASTTDYKGRRRVNTESIAEFQGGTGNSGSKGRRKTAVTIASEMLWDEERAKEKEEEQAISKQSGETSAYRLIPFFNRRLYLSNLPPDCTFEDLRQIFPEANDFTLSLNTGPGKDTEPKTGAVQFMTFVKAQENLRRTVKGQLLRGHYIVVSPTFTLIPYRKMKRFLTMSPAELDKLNSVKQTGTGAGKRMTIDVKISESVQGQRLSIDSQLADNSTLPKFRELALKASLAHRLSALTSEIPTNTETETDPNMINPGKLSLAPSKTDLLKEAKAKADELASKIRAEPVRKSQPVVRINTNGVAAETQTQTPKQTGGKQTDPNVQNNKKQSSTLKPTGIQKPKT